MRVGTLRPMAAGLRGYSHPAVGVPKRGRDFTDLWFLRQSQKLSKKNCHANSMIVVEERARPIFGRRGQRHIFVGERRLAW
jgi:hypothetical protein